MIAPWLALGLIVVAVGGAVLGALTMWLYDRWQIAKTPVQTPAPEKEPLVFVRTWKPMVPEQWAAAFRDWPESDPRWRALWDVTSHHLEAELASGEGLPPESAAICQWAGRVQTWIFLRSQLLQLRKAAEQ